MFLILKIKIRVLKLVSTSTIYSVIYDYLANNEHIGGGVMAGHFWLAGESIFQNFGGRTTQ